MAEPQQQGGYHQGKGSPSSSQVLAIATIVPFGASLLILAGFTLTATVIGLAVTTPLFVIFSPILIPAALVIALAVAGFLTSGAFGVTSLSSFAWMANYLRCSQLPEQLQHAKARAQETLGNLAQRNERTKEVSESGISKAQETVQEDQTKAREAGKAQQENQTS